MPEGMEGIVLVDDLRTNFRSNSANKTMVLRFCKVARYDEVYRDCGLLNQMGGIGARCESDFDTLVAFVEEPWKYPWPTEDEIVQTQGEKTTFVDFPEIQIGCRHHTEDDLEKFPRKRGVAFESEQAEVADDQISVALSL